MNHTPSGAVWWMGVVVGGVTATSAVKAVAWQPLLCENSGSLINFAFKYRCVTVIVVLQ